MRHQHKLDRGNKRSRIDHFVEAELEDFSDLEDRCEDCGKCFGWACKGDASFIPLPGQRDPRSL